MKDKKEETQYQYKTKPDHFTDFEWALYLTSKLPNAKVKRNGDKIQVSGVAVVPSETMEALLSKKPTHSKWEEEFERRIDPDGAVEDSLLQIWDGRIVEYPESQYELDYSKVRAFISKAITQTLIQIKEQIEQERQVNESKWSDPGAEDAYVRVLSIIQSHITEVQHE